MAEKIRRLPRKTKAPSLGLPKPRGDATKNSNAAPSPMTLFERLREAVFRFIMLCALSKTTNHHPVGAAFHDDVVVRRRHSYPNVDHHHSEAVADCIEFIKRKAYSDDEIILDRGSVDADDDLAVSVPVPVR